jgi:hypothetical protein
MASISLLFLYITSNFIVNFSPLEGAPFALKYFTKKNQ